MLHVIDAKHLGGYRIWLKFDNGQDGNIDLESELWGEMFAPLKALELFATVRADSELGTVTWCNGADFAPEFLLEKLEKF